MKTSYKLLTLALVSVSMAGCADLDTEYLGSIVNSEQKEEVLEQNPDMALAGVTGCFSSFLTSGFDSNDKHYDYGYSSYMLGMDSQGMDLCAKAIGYNWYATWTELGDCNSSGTRTNLIWNYIYKQVYSCNTLIGSISADTDDNKLKFFLSQGLALRAFDYWVLAQLYQFNYTVDPMAPSVPIVTDVNRDEVAMEGAPRASLQELYDFILGDLNDAIRLLSETTLTPEKVIDSKPKRMISLATAYGLRARVYLTMHKYAEAAKDAEQAILNFSGRPYSMSEVSEPAFVSLSEPAWMWGIAVSEQDRVITSGICNFPSMMGSFSYGYCTVGAWRWCNAELYNSIPKTDVRKGWWLDEDFESPNLTAQQLNYLHGFLGSTYPTVNDGTSALMPYTQVKYSSYQGVLGQSTPAQDIPLMRVEEMYLIQAEALGMSQSVTAGAEKLTAFVQQYRDPSYACKLTDQEAFQDECWRQRRIELWGEGLSWYDIMRLKKPVNRLNAGFPEEYVYYIEPNSNNMLLCLPLDEINANKKLTEKDNNDSASRPTPIKPEAE